MRSRDERPDGSLLAFARGDVGFPAPSLSVPLQNSLCFFRLPLPAPLSVSLASYFPRLGEIRVYHVPFTYPDGLGFAYSPRIACPRERTLEASLPIPSPFWFKPVSTFGLSELTTFISDSPLLAIPSNLSPSTALVLAVTIPPHGFIALI
jgi:hypothetical protein